MKLTVGTLALITAGQAWQDRWQPAREVAPWARREMMYERKGPHDDHKHDDSKEHKDDEKKCPPHCCDDQKTGPPCPSHCATGMPGCDDHKHGPHPSDSKEDDEKKCPPHCVNGDPGPPCPSHCQKTEPIPIVTTTVTPVTTGAPPSLLKNIECPAFTDPEATYGMVCVGGSRNTEVDFGGGHTVEECEALCENQTEDGCCEASEDPDISPISRWAMKLLREGGTTNCVFVPGGMNAEGPSYSKAVMCSGPDEPATTTGAPNTLPQEVTTTAAPATTAGHETLPEDVTTGLPDVTAATTAAHETLPEEARSLDALLNRLERALEDINQEARGFNSGRCSARTDCIANECERQDYTCMRHTCPSSICRNARSARLLGMTNYMCSGRTDCIANECDRRDYSCLKNTCPSSICSERDPIGRSARSRDHGPALAEVEPWKMLEDLGVSDAVCPESRACIQSCQTWTDCECPPTKFHPNCAREERRGYGG